MSETLGLYYIAKATRSFGGIDMAVANSLGKYFISKSSLKNFDDSLTSSIINIIATVNNVYNFLYQSPPRNGDNENEQSSTNSINETRISKSKETTSNN